MGCSWQTNWVKAKISLLNMHRLMIHKCLKVSRRYLDSYLSCCSKTKNLLWTMAPLCWILIVFSNRGPLVKKIFSLSAITQTRIQISSWKSKHIFIMSFSKFKKKNLAITQSSCQLQPILAETLDISYLLKYFEKKKTGEVLDLYE